MMTCHSLLVIFNPLRFLGHRSKRLLHQVRIRSFAMLQQWGIPRNEASQLFWGFDMGRTTQRGSPHVSRNLSTTSVPHWVLPPLWAKKTRISRFRQLVSVLVMNSWVFVLFQKDSTPDPWRPDEWGMELAPGLSTMSRSLRDPRSRDVWAVKKTVVQNQVVGWE